MSYTGSQIPIALGQIGLRTDEATTSLPPNSLILANNVSFYNGTIAKSNGTSVLNSTALDASIVSVFDWWPTASLQRTIAVTSNGKIWRDTGDGTFSSATPITNLATTVSTDTHIVSGGQEAAAANKKLFIFTGAAQVRVISGDGSSTSAIATPSPDWSAGNFPNFGIIYQGRLCVINSPADPHRIYFSTLTSHEDFTTGSPPTFSVFPGEGDGILCAAVYRGLLFLFKKPFGVYILDGRDPNTSNWTVSKYSDSFGVSSPHSVLQVLTDLIAANSFGSYTSLIASDSFGDFEAGDILSNNLIENYIRSIFNTAALPFTSCVYYPEKKVAMFSGQTTSDLLRNQMILMDVGRQPIRFSIDTKERPNCLALRRDSQKILRPMYGAADGKVYLMDQDSFNRNNSPYVGEFQTTYTDFSFASSELASKNKIFDFVEIGYTPTDNGSFFCDVYVDNNLIQTIEFDQFYGAALDSFVLDTDELSGSAPSSSNRKKLKSCIGKKISFRIYNNTINQSFDISRIIVSFRLSSEQLYINQV